MRKMIFAASSLAALFWVGAASAVPFTSEGIWTSIEGTPSGTTTGIGTNQIGFGEPFNDPADPQSGYVFDGYADSFAGNFSGNPALEAPGDATLDGSLFHLGDYTHENNPIDPPSITGATLALTLDISGNVLMDSFFFQHTETPNNDDPCDEGGVIPCPDLVQIPDPSSTNTVNIGGTEYRLNIIGFSIDGGDTITENFLTLEASDNTAGLYARLIEVPEPPTVTLMGFALLGLAGFIRYRRK